MDEDDDDDDDIVIQQMKVTPETPTTDNPTEKPKNDPIPTPQTHPNESTTASQENITKYFTRIPKFQISPPMTNKNRNNTNNANKENIPPPKQPTTTSGKKRRRNQIIEDSSDEESTVNDDDMDIDKSHSKSPLKTPDEPSPPKKKQKITQTATPTIQIPQGFNMRSFFNASKNKSTTNTNTTDRNTKTNPTITTTNTTTIPRPKFRSPPPAIDKTKTTQRRKKKSTTTATNKNQSNTNTKKKSKKNDDQNTTTPPPKPSATKLKKRPQPKQQTASIIRIPGNQPPSWDPYDVRGQIVRDKDGKEITRIPADQIHIKVDNTNYVHVERFKHAIKTAEKNLRKNQKSMEKLADTYQEGVHKDNTIKNRNETIKKLKKDMFTLNEKLDEKRKAIRSKVMEIAEIKHNNNHNQKKWLK